MRKPRQPAKVRTADAGFTVCPGVRLGYLAGPRDTDLGCSAIATETYISPSVVSESIVNEFLPLGRDRHRSIETVTEALRQRLCRLVAALAHELPDATFTRPFGGYFLWVDFLATVDVDAVFRLPGVGACCS